MVWLAALATGASAQTAAPASTACRSEGGPVLENEARCVAREAEPEPDFSWAPRALLAVPRLAFRTTTELLSAGARLEDEYALSRRAEDLFFNDARTFGVIPTVLYGTGIGANIGVHVIHKDLFGERERLRLRAAYGGDFRQLYDARLDTGRRFGRVRPALGFGFQREDRGRFWGLANENSVDASDAELPLDAQAQEQSVEARYRMQELRANAAVEVRLSRPWSTRVTQVFRHRQLSAGEASDFDRPWLPDVYDPDSLAGFESPLVDVYSELALIWDDRRSKRTDTPRALPASGVRMQAWSGMQAEANEPHSVFGRVGFDVQPFIDLFRGNRILHLRLRGVTALGPLDAIPFLDLPSLGGSLLLRGYESVRFRGRVTLLGSVEYRYPVQENIAAYVFSDAGRAWAGFDDVSLASLGELRVGFGAGLQIYNSSFALLRVQIATSIDGGFFLHFKVNTTDDPGGTY